MKELEAEAEAEAGREVCGEDWLVSGFDGRL